MFIFMNKYCLNQDYRVEEDYCRLQAHGNAIVFGNIILEVSFIYQALDKGTSFIKCLLWLDRESNSKLRREQMLYLEISYIGVKSKDTFYKILPLFQT